MAQLLAQRHFGIRQNTLRGADPVSAASGTIIAPGRESWLWTSNAAGILTSAPSAADFASGFENDVVLSASQRDLLGVDQTTGFDWKPGLVNVLGEGVFDHHFVRQTNNNAADTKTQFTAGRTGGRALYLEITQNGSPTLTTSPARNDYAIYPTATKAFHRFYVKERADLHAFDRHGWKQLFELKQYGGAGGTGTSLIWRMGIQYEWNPVTDNYVWWMKGESFVPSAHWEWAAGDMDADPFPEVPGFTRYDVSPDPPLADQWMKCEVYWEYGNPGRFWFAVDDSVVFDVTDQTRYEDAGYENPLYQGTYRQLLWPRIYVSESWMPDWREFDDIEIYSDWPTGFPP